MRVDPRTVHEAMQNAPVDDQLYRQARAAIKAVTAEVIRELRQRFLFALDPSDIRKLSLYMALIEIEEEAAQ